MSINTNLSLDKCWKMVNRIQLGKTPEEVRDRCHTAETWLKANKVISNEQFDELMMAVAYLHRESYHPEWMGR